eukprot:scaffold143623_cov30-Tisochrysis_lutea.AAC.3
MVFVKVSCPSGTAATASRACLDATSTATTCSLISAGVRGHTNGGSSSESGGGAGSTQASHAPGRREAGRKVNDDALSSRSSQHGHLDICGGKKREGETESTNFTASARDEPMDRRLHLAGR